MDPDSWWQLAVVVVGLILVAFGAAAESASVSISRTRLHHLASEGVSRAKALTSLLEDSGIYASTTVVVRTAGIVLSVGFTVLLALRFYPSSIGIAISLVAAFLVLVILCQLLPRALAARNPEAVSFAIAGPMRALTTLLTPLTRLGSAIANSILRASGSDVSVTMPVVTEEELRLMVSVGEEEGIIEETEKDMIHGIFELEETTAREVMVPRIDVFALESTATVSEAIEAIIREAYSRMPVYEGTIDNVIGILYARDLFAHVRDGEWSHPVKEFVRPAYFIPETKRVDELLRELRQKRVHIAIVVDEYGGTAGLVTIEDLIEEIVGEIQDEYDVEESKIEQISDNEAIFDAMISLDDVNQALAVNLESDEDSIGGFVYDKLGKIPVPGDRIQVNGVGVEVLSTERRRIKKVRVSVQRPMPEAAGAE